MHRVEKTHLPVAALTHPGMKGKNNEDRFGVSAFRTAGQPSTPVLLAVLSDGIGGHRAGEVASEMAINIISQYVAESDGRNPLNILNEAIQKASQVIHQQAQEHVEQQGMGATCASAWISGDRLYTATVGDSRIYLMRDGEIRQLSTDHTWIQEALERGLIEPDEVEGHPNAHVIRRYLGSPAPPEVDFRLRNNANEQDTQQRSNQGMRLQPNDCLLLCSDGLTDLVKDDEILDAFSSASLDVAGQRLIDLANQRGGHDNITLVAIQVPDTRAAAESSTAAPKKRSFSRSLALSCLGVILLAALVGGVAGGYFLYFQDDQPTATPEVTPQASPSLNEPLNVTSTERPGSPTPRITMTRTSTPSPTRFIDPSGPGILSITLTPWPTNTPHPEATEPLPVVTVNP